MLLSAGAGGWCCRRGDPRSGLLLPFLFFFSLVFFLPVSRPFFAWPLLCRCVGPAGRSEVHVASRVQRWGAAGRARLCRPSHAVFAESETNEHAPSCCWAARRAEDLTCSVCRHTRRVYPLTGWLQRIERSIASCVDHVGGRGLCDPAGAGSTVPFRPPTYTLALTPLAADRRPHHSCVPEPATFRIIQVAGGWWSGRRSKHEVTSTT